MVEAAVFLGSRYVASMLFGVEARDPLSFAAAVLFLAATAIVAATIPALRAVRSDPMSALRQD